MKVSFGASKTGDLTCSIDNFPLHSRYNPKDEAKKFVNSLTVDYSPLNIIITGVCLPYLCEPLRQKFPNSQIIAIQFCKDFSEYDKNWDKVFVVTGETSILDFQEVLFNYFGEEYLFSSLFLSWKPSEKLFITEFNITWSAIKNALDKAKILVGTQSYFNKVWVFNSLRFFKNSTNLYFSVDENKKSFLSKLNKPVIITASGTSLKNQLGFLKNYNNSLFIIALSSSLNVLLSEDIIPDCILTTDGGYYAKRHLRVLETKKEYQSIPIIVPPEAKISNFLLSTNPIIPLIYEDSLDSKLINYFHLDYLKGKRNGTVSGTAAELALSLTKRNIYFMGLDLASSKGFSHTQPNQLEIDNCLFDKKISSTENRITPSTFSNQSLDIYRNWFATRNGDFYQRVFRITTPKDNLKKIPNMTDVTNIQVVNLEKLQQDNKSKIISNNTKQIFSFSKECKEFFEKEFEKIKENHQKTQFDWFRIASYTDFIQFIKAKPDEKDKFFDILLEKTKKLFDEIFDFLG